MFRQLSAIKTDDRSLATRRSWSAHVLVQSPEFEITTAACLTSHIFTTRRRLLKRRTLKHFGVSLLKLTVSMEDGGGFGSLIFETLGCLQYNKKWKAINQGKIHPKLHHNKIRFKWTDWRYETLTQNAWGGYRDIRGVPQQGRLWAFPTFIQNVKLMSFGWILMIPHDESFSPKVLSNCDGEIWSNERAWRRW